MKILVLFAVLAVSRLGEVQGNLLDIRESVNLNEATRGFIPPPFFPPYPPTYFNPRPECFSQPPLPEMKLETVVCEPCATPVCNCEPVIQTCQTYTITVCPPGLQTQVSSVLETVVESVVDEKLEEKTDVHISVDNRDVEESISESFATAPQLFGPLGFSYPGFNQIVNSMYPHYGGFSRANVQDLISQSLTSGVRSLSNDDDDHDGKKK